MELTVTLDVFLVILAYVAYGSYLLGARKRKTNVECYTSGFSAGYDEALYHHGFITRETCTKRILKK